MVRLAGVEPATTWFVARYSIQLSYKRTSNFFFYYGLFTTIIYYEE
jgi:hypothetical protein